MPADMLDVLLSPPFVWPLTFALGVIFQLVLIRSIRDFHVAFHTDRTALLLARMLREADDDD